MPPLWREEIESETPMNLQAGMCVLAMVMYNGSKFKLCDSHLLRLSARLQLLPHKPAIINIRLRQLWEARSSNESLRQFLCNNKEWFQETVMFVSASQLNNEETPGHRLGL